MIPSIQASTTEIAVYDQGIALAHGHIDMTGRFFARYQEVLLFVDYPELRGIYGPLGWSLSELFALVNGTSEIEFDSAPMTTRRPAPPRPQTHQPALFGGN